MAGSAILRELNSSGYQNILTKLGPVTEYMADLSPNFGKTVKDKAILF